MFGLVLLAAVTLTNDHVTMSFDDRGNVSSIVERGSGRQLVKTVMPFVSYGTRSWSEIHPERMTYADGKLRFEYPRGGRLVLGVTSFGGGWTFTVEESETKDAARWYCGRIWPVCGKSIGGCANLLSDNLSGVSVRSYDIEDEMRIGPVVDVMLITGDVKGRRFGIAAGPKAQLKAALREMTLVSGRTHTTAGGAWATDSEVSRQSYLNANMRHDRLDDWIDLMERGGFGILHFREDWYERFGDYPVNTNNWPNGMADLKAAVGKVHAAGYLAGMHTLTACISPKCPWVVSEENCQLRSRQEYTLAEDLSAEATELIVNEAPKGTIDVVFTYGGNGNQLRIGSEIVQFTGYTKTPPYKYTGLTRGAFGTKVAAHAKGERADYLEQRYIAFYPEADSPLAEKLAAAIGNVFNTCGFDQIYTDGAEAGGGKNSGIYTAKMRDKIIASCAAKGRPVINEDSCGGGSRSWWFHSRIGAWDSCWWAPKRFFDMHIKAVKRANTVEGDLLNAQMGWWAPIRAAYFWSSQKTDEMEYFASHVSGMDATMSIAGVNVSHEPIDFHRQRLMTILGWYERARLARAFAPGMREAMDAERAEFRLRQDLASGEWKIAPVACVTDDKLTLDKKPAKSALRVELWYGGMNETEAKPRFMTTEHRAEQLKLVTANTNVTIVASETQDETGARAFRLVATNRTNTSRGAWASASAMFSPYEKLAGCQVFRYRVKGDGSGAILNVQLHAAREYGGAHSEHYLKLDFTGWREIETALRETDAERFTDYVWPYTDYSSVFHSIINGDKIADVSYYLNEIPAGGSAAVEVTDVAFVPQKRVVAEKSAVKVNGEVHRVPFCLASGDFAEYENGVWTHYSDVGQPLGRKAAEKPIEFAAGENSVIYGGKTKNGERCRAQVRMFAIGEEKPAYRSLQTLSAEARKHLAYEATEPEWFEPEKGFDTLQPVAIRPGETASVEFRFFGKIEGGVLEFGGKRYEIGTPDKWRGYRIKAEGGYSGVNPVKVTASAAACRVEVVKRY